MTRPRPSSLLKTNVPTATPPTTLGESRIEGAPFPVNRVLTRTHILNLGTTSFNIGIYAPNHPFSQYEEKRHFSEDLCAVTITMENLSYVKVLTVDRSSHITT